MFILVSLWPVARGPRPVTRANRSQNHSKWTILTINDRLDCIAPQKFACMQFMLNSSCKKKLDGRLGFLGFVIEVLEYPVIQSQMTRCSITTITSCVKAIETTHAISMLGNGVK